MSDEFPAGRWRSRWIWADGGSGRHSVALRTVMALDELPARVPARLVAISRYALWVNGAEVSRGPARANPRSQPYDVVDLAPYLRVGDNVVAVVAVRYGGPTPWWLPPPEFGSDLTRGAFTLQADLGDDRWLVTDALWQGVVLDGWTATHGVGVSGRGQEQFDARALPASWDRPDGHDPGWPAAIERRAMATGESGRPEPPSYPLGPYAARTFSHPRPVDIELAAAGDAFLADRIVVGTVVVEADGPAGSEVTVRVAEHLDGDGRPKSTHDDAGIAMTLDGTSRSLETFDLYGLRGLVVDAPPEVDVRRVLVRERTYPVTGDAAFSCSDERLDEIWAIGRRTVSICSLDAYVDCPTREQRAWTGDAVVHQMVDFTTNTDWGLARRYPHLAASPRSDGMLPMAVAGDAEHADFTVIPDWALHWVHGVWNLFRYVGDSDEIARLLPVVEGVLRWFERSCGTDGVPTDVTGWVIIDWAAVHTEGKSAALCGLWARGLLEFAEMAEWVGDQGRARWARSAHERLAAGFEVLWDAERGRYADSWARGGLRPMASQHSQAAAIVGRLAPDDRVDRLVDVLTDSSHHVDAAFGIDGPATPNGEYGIGGALREPHPDPWWDVDLVVRAQPFYRYVVHDALADAGRPDLIAGACLDWTTAMERCATSWTETWYGGTVSHGWSSTPTRDLMQRVLGVMPAEPGFAAAIIDPALGDLARATGRVPCPGGLIAVDVRGDRLTVDSPIAFVHEGRRFDAGAHDITRGPVG